MKMPLLGFTPRVDRRGTPIFMALPFWSKSHSENGSKTGRSGWSVRHHEQSWRTGNVASNKHGADWHDLDRLDQCWDGQQRNRRHWSKNGTELCWRRRGCHRLTVKLWRCSRRWAEDKLTDGRRQNWRDLLWWFRQQGLWMSWQRQRQLSDIFHWLLLLLHRKDKTAGWCRRHQQRRRHHFHRSSRCRQLSPSYKQMTILYWFLLTKYCQWSKRCKDGMFNQSKLHQVI